MQDWLDSLSSAAQTGLQIFNSTQDKPKPVVTAAPKTNYTPFIIGGVALLALVVVVPMLSRK